MKTFYLITISFILCLSLKAQKNTFITISPKVAGLDLQMATDLTDLSGVVFNLDHFDYYLSGLHVIHDGGQDLDLSGTVFLVEPNNHVLYLGYLSVTNIEQINFSIGVPSNINTSQGANAIDIAAYPAGHPLSFQDPAMHWGWTTGYMFMIVGGLADSNADGIPDAMFQLHNVGNSNYSSVQLPVIQTNTSANQIDVYVNCHVDVWLKDLPLATVGILHASTGYNAEVMDNVVTEIVFNQAATASAHAIQSQVGNLFFSNSGTVLKINWELVKDAHNYRLTDNSGKQIQVGSIDQINGSLTFENLSTGMYSFHIFDKNLNELNTLKVVY